MDTPEDIDAGAVNALPVPKPRLSVYAAADGQVFAEVGNDDAWIITDHTIPAEC